MKQSILGDDVAIDVDRLLVSRLLVQANSGGGKSFALRRLLEQTFGRCQHIVIDPEGEFHTLRERFDYVLAGKGGEAAATVETAELLAVRLLELGVSAIVDISELGQDRPAFVAKFLDALVGAPRELWHPVLVVVDEAHRYCPEQGKARRKAERHSIEDSAAAVVSLMDSGRKRGFCGVLATQRVSKLSKDATAECNNKLIGRSVEVDAKRAAEELGLSSRDAMQQLRKLRAGEFFVFGPALSDEIRVVHVGPVETTHPEAGKAAPLPTPPRAKVREVLGSLADLPKEAAEEARTAEQLRARLRSLEAELVAAKRSAPAPVVERVEVPVLRDRQLIELRDAIGMAEHLGPDFQRRLDAIGMALVDIKATIEMAGQLPPDPAHPVRGVHRQDTPTHTEKVAPYRIGAPAPRASSSSMPVGEAAVLRAVIQYASGLRREQLTVLTGYKRSTRDAYIQRLREKGLVDVQGDRVVVSREGVRAMPDAAPLPTGRALQEYWLARLPEGERAILAVLISARGAERSRDHVGEQTGYKRSTRDAYLQRLAAKELVRDVGRGHVKASPTLFEVAP